MIKIENITKKFQSVNVLNSINLEIEKGKLVAIIGSSGSGKTTLLKMINLLIKPTSGKIFVNGEDISKKDIVKLRRKIGYVIQQTGLFPHMTVKENIEIIPKLEKIQKDKIEDRTLYLMDMVGLDANEYLGRYPNELSGGQQQRIGVARAFALDPDIILMDEPFSALDPITRSGLQDELIKLQEKVKKTIVFVTHDMDEAIKISDRICIMNDGKVLQYDIPETILKEPINDFVSDFVGKNKIWSTPQYIRASDIMTPTLEYRKVGVFGKLFKKVIDNKSIEINQDESLSNIFKVIEENNIYEISVIDNDGGIVGTINKANLVSFLSQRYLDVPNNK